MNKVELLNFCKEHFNKNAHITGNWVMFSCPFASAKHKNGVDANPSFGINIEYPHGYNCFSCNSKGKTLERLYTILFDVHDSEYFKQRESFTLPLYEETHAIEKVETLYYEEMFANLEPAYDHPYLISRNVEFELAKKFNICYDYEAERLCFPIYNAHKRCIGIQGRSITGMLPKYKLYPHYSNGKCNPDILYGEDTINFDDALIVVEGMFDVVKVSQVWYNVTSFFGVNPTSTVLKKLSFARKVLMLFDCDDAGSLACSTLYEHLPFGKMVDIRNFNLPFKDPGEMPMDILHNLLKLHLAKYN